jgi:hypothetical protein
MRRDEPILPRCANHPQWPGQLHEVPGVPCRNYHPRPALPEGDAVRMIPLTDGSYAYVDAADYDWLRRWTWHREDGYAIRPDKGKDISMHRQIMQPPEDMVVDHIDGNRANNCRANLRVCTHSENNRNHRKRIDSSSSFKGVFYDKRSHRWGAKCQYRGERIRLGYFDTDIEAARAYDRMAVELFGKFARLNFPQEWPPERRAQVYAQRQEKGDEAPGARGERSECRLQAGKTRPTRVNAELPTPKPQAPGRSARAKGKKKKVKSKSVKPRRAQRAQRGLAALGRNQNR